MNVPLITILTLDYIKPLFMGSDFKVIDVRFSTGTVTNRNRSVTETDLVKG